MSKQKYRVNREIRVPEVRVIDAEGGNLGVRPTAEAIRLANEAGLDLVEVAPNAEPPVVRIMDFGKFIYEQTKKEREARKAQKQIEVKEIQLRPKTNEHHTQFKVKSARGWLEEGNKVKVRIRFRGREITYPEVAIEQLEEIANELSDVAVVEQTPQLDGRTMLMILAPKKKK
ncbi:MAG TPA: translation initiation factor IF-3 [Anaerolineae bacterium]|nr:translation initiation factor IF-3 [Anaerolineae bacterium]HQK15137.1 translation initiation factor IF-3 [Anaerolineae bacterium]